MLIGKGFKKTETEIVIKKEGMGAVKKNRVTWRMVDVYARKGIEKVVEGLEEWLETVKDRKIIMVEGDFNVRTKREGDRVERGWREKKKEKKKNFKDEILNKEGRRLIEFSEEKGLSIMNGDMERDKEGEYITEGRGNTVIDYLIGVRR